MSSDCACMQVLCLRQQQDKHTCVSCAHSKCSAIHTLDGTGPVYECAQGKHTCASCAHSECSVMSTLDSMGSVYKCAQGKHLDVRILLLQITASASDSTPSAHTSNQDVNLAF